MTSSAHAPLTLELKDEGGQDELSVRRRGHRRRRRRRRRREGNFAPIVFTLSSVFRRSHSISLFFFTFPSLSEPLLSFR